LITSHLGTRMREEESDPSNKSTNEHEHTLSQVTRWLERIWDLERLWSFELFLRVNALALVLNENFRRLGYLELWWLGGIYSPQPPNKLLGTLLSMGAPDSPVCHRIGPVHCSVRCHVTQPLGFGAKSTIGALSSCGIRQSGATPDSLVPLWLPALTSVLRCSCTVHLCRVDRCAS
jgi:hypothetical protein